MVQKFSLVKLKNYYDDDYKRFLLSNGDKDKILFNMLKNTKIRISNKLLDKFVDYLIQNIEQIFTVKSFRGKGRIVLISDSRYPLSCYVAKSGEILINFTKRLTEYSKAELISIISYGLVYWAYFNVPAFKNINLWVDYQVLIIHSFMMNMFGKSYGVFNDLDLVNNSIYLSSIHTVVNLWGQPFKKHYSSVISNYKLTSLEKFPELVKSSVDLDSLNFDTIKWIDYLDKFVYFGITMQAVTSRIAHHMSLEALVMMESLDRFFPLIYASMISDAYGNLSYNLPYETAMQMTLKITKYLISSLEV
ncbi:hypothetical protein M0R36_10405 [bacterium]|jgi:hypothetical protein|nr:hypothetical protein [bacterium]